MSFAQDLKDFTTSFAKVWELTKPSEADTIAAEVRKNRPPEGTPVADGGVPVPRASTETPKLSGNQTEFINKIKPFAQKASELTGLDPELIIAQAGVESRWGKSAPGFNYFGIKAKPDEPGQDLMTTEFENGREVRKKQRFRVFKDPEDAARGYADFINKNPRYKPVKEAKGAEAQADAMGKSGYATAPNYGATLASAVGAVRTTLSKPSTTTSNAPPPVLPPVEPPASREPGEARPLAPVQATNPMTLPESKVVGSRVRVKTVLPDGSPTIVPDAAPQRGVLPIGGKVPGRVGDLPTPRPALAPPNPASVPFGGVYDRRVLPGADPAAYRRSAFDPSGAYSTDPKARYDEYGQEILGYAMAAGGPVEALPVTPQVNVANTDHAGSNPAVLQAMENPTAAYGEGYDPKAFVSTKGAADAVEAGMEYLQRMFGFDQGGIAQANPNFSRGAAALAANVGAASPDEVEAIKDTVDPGRTMTEGQRTIAAYNGAYNSFMKRGYLDRAARMAGAMLMAAKREIAEAGVMMQVAAENGDMENVARAAEAAYNVVPNGQDLKAKANKDGTLSYEITGPDGRVTERGKANIDDVVAKATGMRNGSEWFSSLGLIKTASKDKVAEREEKRRAALEEFNSDPDDVDVFESYRGSLSPERQIKFDKLSPTDQKALEQRYAARVRENRREEQQLARRADTREQKEIDRELQEEHRKRREALVLFREELRQGRFDKTYDRLIDKDTRAAIERQLTREEQEGRFKQGREDRIKRQAELAERALNRDIKRVEEKARNTGGKLTAGERKLQAMDATLDARVASMPDDMDGGTPIGLPTETKMVAARAGLATDKWRAGLTGKEREATMFDEEATAGIRDLYTKGDEGLGIKPIPNIPPVMRQQLTTITTDIARMNDVSREEAYNLTRMAVNPGIRPRLMPDGTVQLHPNARPVRMTPQAMIELARITAQRVNLESNTADKAATAQPGTTGKPRREFTVNPAQRDRILDTGLPVAPGEEMRGRGIERQLEMLRRRDAALQGVNRREQ